MATAIVRKKGHTRKWFGLKKNKSKIPAIGVVDTESTASRGTKSKISRVTKKSKKVTRTITNKLHLTKKDNRVITSDTSEDNTARIGRDLVCESNCDDSHSSDLTFTPSPVKRSSVENQVVEESVSGKSGLLLESAEDHGANIPTSETEQSSVADTDTTPVRGKDMTGLKQVRLREKSISRKNSLLHQSAQGLRPKFNDNLSPKAIKILQKLKNRKPNSKQSGPIDETQQRSYKPDAKPSAMSGSTLETSGADSNTDTNQTQLQAIAAPLLSVVENSEESHPPVMNSNSYVEETRNTKKGWLQNFFTCRSGGSFILHSC